MIVVITYLDKGIPFVSHGVCSETLRNITLPAERLDILINQKQVYFDKCIGEYVLLED